LAVDCTVIFGGDEAVEEPVGDEPAGDATAGDATVGGVLAPGGGPGKAFAGP
jgi:hypothetical protein